MKDQTPVIVRANESGVWYGMLTAHADDWSWVELADAQRLWAWQTKSGVSCSALATAGINRAKSIIAPTVAWAVICGPCEVLAVSSEAVQSYVG